MSKQVMLIILDGWGKTSNPLVSGIDQWNTPFYHSLLQTYPNSELQASELAVGLPEGQFGNSEVGHTTLGAWRVLYQDIVKINLAIESWALFLHPLLIKEIAYAKVNSKNIHILGLCSDGGVHSHINHLVALAQLVHRHGAKASFHLFGDGRDTKADSSIGFVSDIIQGICTTNSKISSLIGRYYAMDRDHRRERIHQAYELITSTNGNAPSQLTYDALFAQIQASYAQWITDEFLPGYRTEHFVAIQPWDVVIFANFRSDRGRELTIALTQENLTDHNMYIIPDLHYLTMTRYDESFTGVQVLYDKDNVSDSLGAIIAKANRTQIRIAETEKYPHVTFFFSGGREKPFDGESRILIPSPKVATYDLQPSMGTREITDAIIPILKNKKSDFICLNFAAPDMVGHTGVWEAAIEAGRIVDESLQQIVQAGLEGDYTMIVLADHGNIDQMIQDDGSPHTAHTLARVPCILINWPKDINMVDGSLADIAPTILSLMDIPVPTAMTGKYLLK